MFYKLFQFFFRYAAPNTSLQSKHAMRPEAVFRTLWNKCYELFAPCTLLYREMCYVISPFELRIRQVYLLSKDKEVNFIKKQKQTYLTF